MTVCVAPPVKEGQFFPTSSKASFCPTLRVVAEPVDNAHGHDISSRVQVGPIVSPPSIHEEVHSLPDCELGLFLQKNKE